ncbi:hypothetical protein [Xylophilus ampelinus]|uniref:Uncharacterized protein n=1 Tax=Xylophilus ampelinus TaxID=54067 RepID=A0A318T2L2_9BURK|nr:hypothetical protein [Xylophilus ampelinus]MCS4509121.1 hypothetical protein [Xylophilus ampelinus]PYE79851.1 hypothetical protein DFQ15_101171 [Xylophilus ampelinus]
MNNALVLLRGLLVIAAVSIIFSSVIWVMPEPTTLGTTDKISVLSMVGTWFAGVGAIYAAWTALRIAKDQTKSAKVLVDRQIHAVRISDAIKGAHHSIAVVNDIRGRITFIEQCFIRGDRSIIVFITAVEGLLRRYESLYDRDLYRSMPGPIVDQITGLSGRTFGLEAVMVSLKAGIVAPEMGLQPLRFIPEEMTQALNKLEKATDCLMDALQEEAQKLYEIHMSHKNWDGD